MNPSDVFFSYDLLGWSSLASQGSCGGLGKNLPEHPVPGEGALNPGHDFGIADEDWDKGWGKRSWMKSCCQD